MESYGLTRTSFEGEGKPPGNSYAAPEGYIFVRTVGPALTTPLFAKITDTGQAFGSWSVELHSPENDSITARLQSNLPIGVHTGTLLVQFCESISCSVIYPSVGGTIAYSVTIRPQMSVQVYVSDELVESLPGWIGFNKYLSHMGGQKIDIRANLPIDVRYANRPGVYELIKDETISTETRWVGTLNSTHAESGEVYVEIHPSQATGSDQMPFVFFFGFD